MLIGSVPRFLNVALGICRSENWWYSKIPPLLAVAVLDIVRQMDTQTSVVALLGCYLWSVCAVAPYGHVVNDAFDVEADRKAGKQNHMAGVSWPWRMSLCFVLVVVGLLPALIVPYSPVAVGVLALNYVWPTVYSVPPLRLKEQGIAGLCCDMLGSHVTPTVLALLLFSRNTWPGAFAAVVTVWAMALGIKGILHHQIADRANDIRSGTVTFATNTSPEALSRFLTLFNLFFELPVSVVLVIVTWGWAPLFALAFVAYNLLEISKYLLGFKFALTVDDSTTRRSVPFTNEAFYVCWVPLAASVQLGVAHAEWIWLPVALVVLFYPNFSTHTGELRAVLCAAQARRSET